MHQPKVRDFATVSGQSASPDGSTTVAPDPTFRAVMDPSIRSAFEATGVDSEQMTDEDARFSVSLSSKPLSLYHDQESGRLHVLLDLTVVRPAKLDGRKTPVGVADPESTFARVENTMSLLDKQVKTYMRLLSIALWEQLHDSLCTVCKISEGTAAGAEEATPSLSQQDRRHANLDHAEALFEQCGITKDPKLTIETGRGLIRRDKASQLLSISSVRDSPVGKDAGSTDTSGGTTAFAHYDAVQAVTQALNKNKHDMVGFSVHPRVGRPEDRMEGPVLIAGPEMRLQVTLFSWPWGECHEKTQTEGSVPPAVPEVGQLSDDEEISEEE